MAFTIGVPAETATDERRVALVPEVVGRLVKKGMEIIVEAGAGAGSYHGDAAFTAAGARIGTRVDAFGADLVLKVAPPSDAEVGMLREGAIYIGFLSPLDAPQVTRSLAAQKVTAFSTELVPRISRAQKMDALSAMSSIAGYKAVLKAAEALPKFFPLLTTAAGTVKPANVLVLGAGVAGLQAIATARRLGAKVWGYDVRDAVREEIESLGATFVQLELETAGSQDAGGYAKALAEEKAHRQTELLVPHIGSSDVVVSTALIPGRRAPLLITEEAVKAMSPGSIVVDLAAANGGNCAFTEPGQTIVKHGVTIMGPTNLPAEMPVHASQMYARVLMAMILDFYKDGAFQLDFGDDIIKGACVTHAGEVVNERVKSLLAA
ncbi:MAG: Re/Si-specific NAD(P)(+) transhydrogenase subunit alpha [Rhodothermales bacterium]|nr:Re/Si-specific NAD(P)(+) transhydrogenase subunit alpha [Rhodothermales bacterium]